MIAPCLSLLFLRLARRSFSSSRFRLFFIARCCPSFHLRTAATYNDAPIGSQEQRDRHGEPRAGEILTCKVTTNRRREGQLQPFCLAMPPSTSTDRRRSQRMLTLQRAAKRMTGTCMPTPKGEKREGERHAIRERENRCRLEGVSQKCEEERTSQRAHMYSGI